MLEANLTIIALLFFICSIYMLHLRFSMYGIIMLRILVIPLNKFPVPAVLGGAVETLIQYLVHENIKGRRIQLTVYSIDNPAARKAYSQFYKEAEIIYIKRTKLDDMWDKLWPANRAFLKVFKRLFAESPFIKRVYKDLRKKDFDYIVFEGNYYEKCGLFCRKIGRDKLIIHWHEEMRGRRIHSEWFLKHICVSNFVARILASTGYIRLNDVFVLPNCVNIELFSNPLPAVQRAELLVKYNLSDNDFIITFIGRTIPEKGTRELLLAFKEICNTIDNCKLLIIGSTVQGYEWKTSYQEELESIADRLRGKVIFTGFVHHDEMWKTLKLSNVGVVPSLCNEGAGMTTMEIMAASIPLITFNVGGIPEYVDKNASIILDWDKDIVQKLADSILALMKNQKNAKKMSELGYEHARKFNLSKYYNDFCDLLYAIDKET